MPKDDVLRFPGGERYSPEVDAWFEARPEEFRRIAKSWFSVMRDCGDDFRELLHDGHPTACVHDVAFAYVNIFTSHVNVGFFNGATLNDPEKLLEGTGKRMRHVKLRAGSSTDSTSKTSISETPLAEKALSTLIKLAYLDAQKRNPISS